MLSGRATLPAWLGIALFILAVPVCAATVEDVRSRGEHVRIVIEGPAKPVATMVLFAGGHGVLGISKNGDIDWGRANFLVRTRGLFHSEGLLTVLIDAPRDRQHSGLFYFRDTAEHAQDVAEVIAHLRVRFPLPVWLVGTSRGTESVASAAVHLSEGGPNGIVLTASMLEMNTKGRSVLEMDLGRISVPTLIAHHADDECHVTPYAKVDVLQSKLLNAGAVELLTYQGGDPRGDPCKAHHFHGFKGIEKRVVSDIAAWIKAH